MRPPRRWLAPLAGVTTAAVLLAACSGGTGAPGATKGTNGGPPTIQHGGVVTYAEAPGSEPNFISPLQTAQYLTVYDIEGFANLMWPPLVYIGEGGKAVVDKAKSLAQSIAYSDGGRAVTIQLKDWDWSDGRPITSRDVQFFYNLVKANRQSWGYYTQGEFPDNVSKFLIDGPRTFTLDLTRTYNPSYYTYDQLSEITPIPQHAWDKTSIGGKAGNYDETKAGAVKVWNMIFNSGRDLSTFATNPLWKVVDGPWSLQAYQKNGQATFVPNKKYSGQIKPRISKFVELPFTSNDSEFNVLLTGSTIDVGYVPLLNVKKATSELEARGYKLAPYYELFIDFDIPNLTQPQVGSLLSQLYVRQAMQELIPQKQIIKQVYDGFGVVGAGPVPLAPSSPYISALEKKGGPYPYNPSRAKRLLKAHGWQVVTGGTDTCTRPGTGSNECGKGIRAGAKLELSMLYSSGSQGTDLEYQDIQSSMAQGGVTVQLKSEPFNSVVGIVNPCNPSKPSAAVCGWQLGDYGGWVYSPLPIGILLFTTGAVDNSG
ncbi:MAG: ABC transporter substrate-binding protein, partial [Acidimicrobiales bacterium]